MIEKTGDFTKIEMLQYHFNGNDYYQEWATNLDATNIMSVNHIQVLEKIKQQILLGKVSSLAYHIHNNLFKISMLSSYSGIPKRHIKKHLKPEIFNQLDDETLKKYAAVFRISIEELKNV